MASPACPEETEDGEAQVQDEPVHHSLSCLLWVHSVTSSPGGRAMRYSTASSRVRFWKLVSFTCHRKALGHDLASRTEGMGTSRGPRDISAQSRVGEGTGPCHLGGDTLGRYWTQKSWGQSRCSSIWSIFSPGYLQDLVTFPDALAVSQAPLLHARHEDAHIVPTRQPQPHTLGLHKPHDPGVGAVPAMGKYSQPSGDMQGQDREVLTL